MKPRKVMVHLELLTDVPIKDLKEKESYKKMTMIGYLFKVQQVTVQVVKEDK